MKKIFFWLTAITAFLLPLHGGVTVFLPNDFAWWKELVLIILGGLFVWSEIKNITNIGLKKWMKNWSKAEVFALGFFIVSDLLFLFSSEKSYAFYALRYLVFPVIIWFLVTRLIKNFDQYFKSKILQNFGKFFVTGLVVSVLFAVLFQQLQLSDTLIDFYSQTASSWVPGQTLQKWHEVGSLVRWQGLSSGPIEFSHLLVLGVGILPLLKINKRWKNFVFFAFSIGIFFSFSRSAILAWGILVLAVVLANKDWKKLWKKYKKFFIAGGLILMGIGLFFAPKILDRAGTSDHFTRPMAALEKAFENPVAGNLVQLGPVARIKNLHENNDDKALIAENVLIDVFAQMGLFGIFFFVLWLWQVHKNLPKKYRPIFYGLFIMMNLATIFDMTPISIAYFYVFGLVGRK